MYKITISLVSHITNSRPNGRLFVSMALLFILAACSPSQPAALTGPIMGTQYRIVVNCPKVQGALEYLHQIALDEMNTVNSSMSTYQADSEISKFNQLKSTEWVSTSKGLFDVLSIAKAVYSQSQGALDPTVSDIVDLWGFGAGSKQTITKSVPKEEDLKKIAKQIGFKKLVIDQKNQRIKKQLPQLSIDLSAVAKGYAVDRVSEMLSAKGCDNHLVDIGGELKATGVNQLGEPWRVGIEKPILGGERAQHLQQLISLNNGLASSGDYRNYFEKGGKRYSHMIDPRTYRPINHTLASVTVIHESAAMADAWATALMVLGEQAYGIADKKGLAAYFIFRDDSQETLRFITKSTKQFDKSKLSK